MSTTLKYEELLNNLINKSDNLIKSFVSKRSDDAPSFYYKGWTQSGVGNINWKTVGCEDFDDITLPSTNISLQISSTNVGDTNHLVRIDGYDSNFTSITENISLNSSNSRTPVSLVNQYFRIKSMLHIAVGNDNIGDVYLSIDGSSLTNGKPNNASDYIYHMKNGTNAGFILNGVIGGTSSTSKIYPSKVIFATSNDVNEVSHIRFQLKYTTSTLWQTHFLFPQNEKSGQAFTWSLESVAPIPNPTPNGIDVKISVIKNTGGGNFEISAAIGINLI